MSESPKLSEIIAHLESVIPVAKVVLPELSPGAHARINATRERCEASVEEARRQREKLLEEATRRMEDPGSVALRKRAHEILQAAQSEAALKLLDAQASEYLPLTGEHFPYRTLEILAGTSVEMFGGRDAVELRLHEWRARWWGRQAAHGVVTSEKSQANRANAAVTAARRGYRTEVRKWMEKQQLKTISQAAERLGIGYDVLKNIMTSKGKKRYGDETLKDVLKKIGHSTP